MAYSFASDPSPLQDFCVADSISPVVVNGFVCKNLNLVTVNDFTLVAGFDKPGNTKNSAGSNVNLVFASNLPGLNMLGISLARLDFAPGGLVTPHYHPRATEGDVFVFPKGLIHFQYNQGQSSAIAISGLSSQNPGLVVVASTFFGANPSISDDVLVKAFMLEKNTVDWLQA
ncbi:hypothetical protein LUZ60_017340 [Juncus effusus]|nr:hypothetical protein LUZ60_017340 [Juncus effusus]